jgi:hypothetical protein
MAKRIAASSSTMKTVGECFVCEVIGGRFDQKEQLFASVLIILLRCLGPS